MENLEVPGSTEFLTTMSTRKGGRRSDAMGYSRWRVGLFTAGLVAERQASRSTNLSCGAKTHRGNCRLVRARRKEN